MKFNGAFEHILLLDVVELHTFAIFSHRINSNATPIRWFLFSFDFICLDADYVRSVYKHKNRARMVTANILIFILFFDSFAIMMAPEPNTVRKNSETKIRRRTRQKLKRRRRRT